MLYTHIRVGRLESLEADHLIEVFACSLFAHAWRPSPVKRGGVESFGRSKPV